MTCQMPESSTSREELAQRLSRELSSGLCSSNWFLWDQMEKTYTTTWDDPRLEAQGQAAAARACHGCPLMQTCHQWAHADRYTGIAAGLMWFVGKPRPIGYLSACAPVAA